jgi:hypothetical protein
MKSRILNLQGEVLESTRDMTTGVGPIVLLMPYQWIIELLICVIGLTKEEFIKMLPTESFTIE